MMVFNISNIAASSLAESIRYVDPIQVCASKIRTALDNYNFGLENSFCDAEYLKIACNNMKIPDTILHFFGIFFFNFNTDTYQEAAESIRYANGVHLSAI